MKFKAKFNKSKTKDGKKKVVIVPNSKHFEYSIDFNNGIITFFVGDDQYDYELPSWVTWNVKIYDENNKVYLEEL